MVYRNRSVFLLVAAAAAFGAVGCGLPPSRIGFIEKLSKENRKIAHSTHSFRTAVLPLKSGQTVEAASVRSAYQEMESAVKEVRADMDAQMLPPSSSSAKPLLEAYKKYLDGEQNILTNDLLPIVKKVEEPGGSPAEKWGFVNNQFAQVVAKENADYAALEQAEKAYASEHNYTLQSLEVYLNEQKNGKQ